MHLPLTKIAVSFAKVPTSKSFGSVFGNSTIRVSSVYKLYSGYSTLPSAMFWFSSAARIARTEQFQKSAREGSSSQLNIVQLFMRTVFLRPNWIAFLPPWCPGSLWGCTSPIVFNNWTIGVQFIYWLPTFVKHADIIFWILIKTTSSIDL